MGYYTQHQMDTLRAESTVLGEIRRLSDPHCTEEELMSVLGLFLLGESYFDRQITQLSGGEKCRLVLASLFLRRCNLLLLDEPTNHLDLESREALLKALQNYNGTLLMVAHDRWLLQEAAAEAWELSPTGLTVYENYQAFEASRHLPAEPEKKDEKADKNEALNQLSRDALKKQKREQAERRNALHRKLKPLRTAYERCENELNDTLNLQSAIEEELVDPEVYADQKRSGELLKRFEECKDKSEKLLEKLQGLEEEIEKIRLEGDAD